MVGNILAGRYRIESLIGSGGMANVYKAYDEKNGMVVAIKMLKDEHKDDAEFLRRFEREAKAVLTLSHPNIVQSYDVGADDDGANYIVLEYVEGQTLKDYIKAKGCLGAKETVSIAGQVLDALAHAHECGIIHRDVKPQNVMIAGDGSVKLTDFGIARDASATTRTFAGTNVIGSVHYISPEQARGDNVTAESDIYSAAIMVYEMLTGTVPFAGENTVAIALKHLQEEMIPPIEVNPKVSRAMSDVVMKGAAKDPALRYSNALAMKKDLERALNEPYGRFARITKRTERVKSKRSNRLMLQVSIAIMGAITVFALATLLPRILDGGDTDFLVPSLVGKQLEEARSLAELRGFALSVSDYVISSEFPAGQVTKQTPSDGARGKEGDTITVEVSGGSGYAIVPDLTGCTMQEASLKLAEENLNVGNVGYMTADVPEGQIIKQEPVADTRAPEFDAVDIWISGTENQMVEMPPLTGQNLATAIEMLENSGLEQIWLRMVTPEEGAQEDTVHQQSPAANMSIGKNTLAEVWINRTDLGNYAADIAINIDVEGKSELVTVTAVMENGMQTVLYENKVQAGLQQPIAFTGYMRRGGEYECIVYSDGAEVKRVNANFTLR